MGGSLALNFGLPTSVGGLSFDDGRTAIDFVLEHQPAFPTVPRLERTGTTLIHQLASMIPGTVVSEPGLIGFADAEALRPFETQPESLRSELDLSDLDNLCGAFSLVAGFAETIRQRSLSKADSFLGVRIGVLGPVTTTLALRNAGVPLPVALELGVEAAATTSVKLMGKMRRVVGEGMVATVFSEPALIGAMHPTFPLLSGQIHEALGSVVDRIDARRADGPMLIGVHVAGRTDWTTIISTGVSLISVPVTTSLEGAAGSLQSFLDAGGTIAWGAVPVDEPLGTTDELLWRRLGAFWCNLVGVGVDPFQLRSQSLVSAAGGLSHFGTSQTENVYSLIDSLSTRVRRQAAGTRLSLGA